MDSGKLLVSIIIPVYNVADYIERCLMSVLNQTYKTIEVVLVDDYSTDGSMDVARRTVSNLSTDRTVHYLRHNRNMGVSVARNTGIDAANGEYIYFVDSDDELTLDCIDLLIKHARGAEMVIGEMLTSRGKLFKNLNLYLKNKAQVQGAYFSGGIYDMPCNKLISRKFILDNKLFFKPGLIRHEDFLWVHYVCMECSRVSIIKRVTYWYHIRPGSLNMDFTHNNLNDYSTALDLIWKDMADRSISMKQQSAFLNNIIYMLKKRAIRDAKLLFGEFKKLDYSKYISDSRSYYYISMPETLIKSLFLKLPSIIQYRLIRFFFV